MRNYLSNYVKTLSKRREERVGALLEEARVGKEQLTIVAQRLNESVSDFTPLLLRGDEAGGLIRSDITSNNVRDIGLRIRDLYTTTNLISLLLESHAEVLSSEIASLEKELIAMDKMAANFSFLLSDNQAFDYAYLESFNDELLRLEGLDLIPDRSGFAFQALELATVRPDEGVLTMAPDSATFTGLGLTVERVRGNSTAYTIAESDLNEVVRSSRKGWKIVIGAANPVNAPLPTVTDSGSQILLEFRLTSPSPASEIKILPFADVPIEILKITLYSGDDDSQFTDIVTGKRVLDKPYTEHFRLQPVSRFRMLINQPVYQRKFAQTNTIEDRYRSAIDRINELNRDSRRATFSHRIANIERAVEDTFTVNSRPTTDLRPDRGVMGAWVLGETVRQNNWRAQGRSTLITPSFAAGEERLASLDRRDALSVGGSSTTGSSPVSMVFSDVFSTQATASNYQYYYTLGLKNVSIGVERTGGGSARSVYLSDVIPSPGEVGEVRLKTAEVNVIHNDPGRDSKLITSVEHSVTNVSNPDLESDWVPILPVGTSSVVAERLFPDRYGKAYTRFPFATASGIVVYRDGRRLSLRLFTVIRNADGTSGGVDLPVDSSGQHIYTCDYQPTNDPTTVNFSNRGFARETKLVAASDETGAGELFLSTGSRNTVQLANTPYVNLDLTDSPISVVLDNGELAFNLTDYELSSDVIFPATGYYYIHSGSVLMFNQPIRTPFRVFYQYMQNTVRFRTVLRCNSNDFASPKVDYVHVKTKTRKPIIAG